MAVGAPAADEGGLNTASFVRLLDFYAGRWMHSAPDIIEE